MSDSMCVKCEKFFGNPQNLNMCSVCFKYSVSNSGSINKSKVSRKKSRSLRCQISPKLPSPNRKIILDAISATKKLVSWDSGARAATVLTAILIDFLKSTNAITTILSRQRNR